MTEAFFHYFFSNPRGGTIHRDDCSHCRNGHGQAKAHMPPVIGAKPKPGWTKLVDVTEANVAAYALKNKMRLCGQCLGIK